jgi:hypothetical protein
MIRLNFYTPQTALEIRDPITKICQQVAEEQGVHASFTQGQQVALDGHPGIRHSQRQRIGNGLHKVWAMEYFNFKPVYEYRKRRQHPTLIGKLLIRGPVIPSEKQFGGFDYGELGQERPTYNHVTLHTPSELGLWSYTPLEPSAELLQATQDALKEHFEEDFPRLFDIADFLVDQDVAVR